MIFCGKYSPYQVKGSEQWSVEIVLLEMLNAPGSFLFVTFATTVSPSISAKCSVKFIF